MLYFSASTQGFYESAIHGANIPADAVVIGRDEHNALIAGQALGRMIVADERGHPVLADRPGPSVEQQLSMVEARAKQLIAESDWSVLPDVELVNRSDFLTYRAALRAIILSPAVDPTWPVAPDPIW